MLNVILSDSEGSGLRERLMNRKQIIVLLFGMAAILLFDYIDSEQGAKLYLGLLFLAIVTGGGIYIIRDKKDKKPKDD